MSRYQEFVGCFFLSRLFVEPARGPLNLAQPACVSLGDETWLPIFTTQEKCEAFWSATKPSTILTGVAQIDGVQFFEAIDAQASYDRDGRWSALCIRPPKRRNPDAR